VGLGVTSGTVPFDVLDGVANETGGIMEQTATAYTATRNFLNTLVSTLKGNTLSLLSSTSGVMARSSSSATTQFLIDASITRAVFVLSYQGRGGLGLQIIPPGGCGANGCTQPVSVSGGQGWIVQAIDIPGSGPIGQWGVKVVADESIATAYQLSIYAVEGKLEYRFNVPQTPLGTGGTMTIAAEVSYNGASLTGLGNPITVHIDRPGTGVGTFLHNNNVPSSVLGGGSTGGDSTSPYESKFLYLSSHSNFLSATGPQPIPTTYTLLDNGNLANGDAKANDGIYSTIIGNISVPGEYVFSITMDFTTATTGHVQRIETIKRQVQVTPDPGASVVDVAGAGAGAWTITVDPVDKFGNYLGPGYVSAIQVQSSAGTLSAPTDAIQTGLYAVNLTGVPTGVDPVISINVGSTQIRNGKLSTLGNGKHCGGLPFGLSAFPLLGGIVVVGLMAYRPRRKEEQREEQGEV
jgi:hypothetical protein